MPRYDWYILRVWRSGRTDGEQWAARLEQPPDGVSLRFSAPHDLLAYLAAAVEPDPQAQDAAASPGEAGTER